MKSAIERALYILGSRDKKCTINQCHGCEVERKEAIDILTAALEEPNLTRYASQANARSTNLPPNEEDAVTLWAEIHRLNAALKGPGEFATWYDAAVDERRRRVVAEKELKAANLNAERYHKLRAMNWHDSPLCVVRNPRNSVKLGYDCPSGDRLDEVIDELP